MSGEHMSKEIIYEKKYPRMDEEELREFGALDDTVTVYRGVTPHNEDEFKDISTQIEQLNKRIDAIRKSQSQDTSYEQRLEIIQKTIDQRKKNSQTYDDSIVSQMVECIKVFRDGKLIIIFGGGYEVEEHI